MNKVKLNQLKSDLAKIKATNKSALYNTMLYWSQKPFNITRYLIENLSNSGNLIMDPFMGSGVTVLEATRKNTKRNAIGVDVNEMPIFLCRQSLSQLSQEQIESLFDFMDKVRQLNPNYQTSCPNCQNDTATIVKTLYDREPEFNIREIFYSCKCKKGIQHKEPTGEDKDRFLENHECCHIDNISLLENSRIAVKKDESIADKFSKRNFYILDCIKGLIDTEKDPFLRNVKYYVYASIIHKSKILDIKMSSQWPLWIPKKNCVERNVVEVFLESMSKFISARKVIDFEYNADPFVDSYSSLKEGNAIIFGTGIQNVSKHDVPDDVVDLVITDPPYLGQVPYSEYMQIYKAFLGKNIDFTNEIVMTNAKERNIQYNEYLNMMDIAYSNISRIMKPNAIMCMYFHDSNLSVWADLVDMFNKNGFSFISTIHINKTVKTLKKILDPKKTMSGETLILLEKAPSNRPQERSITKTDIENIRDISIKTIEESGSKSVTTSKLYDDGVLNYLIEQNILRDCAKQYNDLADLFAEILEWNCNTGEWQISNI